MPTATRQRSRSRKRARRVDANPTLSVCGCGADVLLVNAPGPLVVELQEVLPAFPCPTCTEREYRGQAPRDDCWRCDGTHRIGHEGPIPAGVALDELDRARFYAEGQLREPGEGVYKLHLCPYTMGAAAA